MLNKILNATTEDQKSPDFKTLFNVFHELKKVMEKRVSDNEFEAMKIERVRILANQIIEILNTEVFSIGISAMIMLIVDKSRDLDMKKEEVLKGVADFWDDRLSEEDDEQEEEDEDE